MKNQQTDEQAIDTGRINRLAEGAMQITIGAEYKEIPISSNGDSLDAIAVALNTMSEELIYSRKTINEYNHRLSDMMEKLLKYTLLDFTDTLAVGNEGDEVDAIAIGINILIEELRGLLEAQKKHVEQVETVNKQLSDFAYIVSHDLKAPLRAIGALSGFLLNDYSDKLDEEGKEKLELLLNRANRMNNLIEGILTYSRIDRVKERAERVDPNEVVEEAVHAIAPPAHIQIKIDKKMPVVFIVLTALEQIFMNLLSNAVKYMDKAEGLIRVGCIDEEDHWKFYVADNGPGIEAQYFEKIFQIFQTLSPRDQVESTGIGLTIVKKIVETHHGKIWLESIPGEGTTFFFTLPKN